ncbi:nuclease [Lysobacteraceae bacterium NML07-0707]|nr:nuclease [Xanthomonadaceae bacterium NML07-0707]
MADGLPFAIAFLKESWWLLPLLFLLPFLRWLASHPRLKGALGERRVRRKTARTLDSSVYRVFEDLVLDDEKGLTQIDHVYVSVYGVFALETKNMGGWIFGGERQREWTQVFPKVKRRFQNPLHQNYRHQKALERMLGLSAGQVHSVVVFAGNAQFKTNMPAQVCYLDDYADYILSFSQQVLSEQECLVICERLSRLSQAGRTRKDAHRKSLRSRYGV